MGNEIAIRLPAAGAGQPVLDTLLGSRHPHRFCRKRIVRRTLLVIEAERRSGSAARSSAGHTRRLF
jgi:hypothetical protein